MSIESGPESEADSPHAVATLFAELGENLTSMAGMTAFDAVTRTALHQVGGADAVSLTTLRNGTFTTVSATHERADYADALQYSLRSGPCVDAILDDALYRPEDLRHDDRWPVFGQRAHQEFGWTSMLSYRLNTSIMTEDVIAGLNIYSEKSSAFDDLAVRLGLLLATHGALAVAAAVNLDHARNLKHALANSREIGVALGILMTRYGLTRDQAFDLLRIASQHRNRKLSDIATEVAETGALELPRTAGRRLTRSGTSAKALHNPSSAVFQGLGEG